MQRLLEKLSFSRRILLVMTLPLLGLFVFASFFIYKNQNESQKTKRELETVTELTELGTRIAATIHEWQKERGRSAGFLGSGGKNFAKEISAQYDATDRAVSAFEGFLASNEFVHQGDAFEARLALAADYMRQIPHLRKRVLALDVPASEAVGKYTRTINAFLEVIDMAANITERSDISNLLVSYNSFLRAKENMGIERAVLSNAFGANSFKGDFFQRYCTVLANQATHLQNFKAYGRETHWDLFQRTVVGEAVKEVDRLEKLAFEKALTGQFEVTPDYWFTQITAKINLMKEVEDQISKDILASTDSIKSKNSSELKIIVAISVSIILISTIVSYWIAYNTKSSLQIAIHSLNTGVAEVATAAGEVSKASISMSTATNQQTSSLTHTIEALDTITAVTQSNGKLAGDANEITAKARDLVDNSLKEMDNLQVAMDEIKSSSDEISAIIKTIDEIAFQTNILALNAAVEAARAGDAGAGFAVVADEVRNLAQRSARAANDTTQKIEDSIHRAHNGTRITSSVGKVLTSIVTMVREVDEVVSKIDSASKEQLDSIKNIQEAVREQETVVTCAASTTEQTAAASEELYGQAQEMKDSIFHLALEAGLDRDTLGESKKAAVSPANEAFSKRLDIRPRELVSTHSGPSNQELWN